MDFRSITLFFNIASRYSYNEAQEELFISLKHQLLVMDFKSIALFFNIASRYSYKGAQEELFIGLKQLKQNSIRRVSIK